MSEFDTRSVTNPLEEDFTHAWNGEPYTIPAGETKSFPEFLAVHLAKHLADKIMIQGGRYEDKINQMTGRHTARSVGKPEKTELMNYLLDAEKQIDVVEGLEQAARKAAGGSTEVKVKKPETKAAKDVKEKVEKQASKAKAKK